MAVATDAAWVQAYLGFITHEKRLAARTVALYHDGLQRLLAAAQEHGCTLAQLQPAQLRQTLAQHHHAGFGRASLALWLSCWRGFFAWLAAQIDLPYNPAQSLRAPRAAQPLPKALAVDVAVQLAAYRAAAPDDAWQEARDAACTELLYSSGLRVGELVQLDARPSAQALGWVDVAQRLVHVTGKGSKRRSVPVGGPALLALQQWLALRAQPFVPDWAEPALFVGVRGGRLRASQVWQRLRLRGQQAGLAQPVHPHMLRHSCASHILQSGCDLRAVQELLGHASIASTQIYTRLDFQHLARVYDQAHPRAQRTTQSPQPGVQDGDTGA